MDVELEFPQSQQLPFASNVFHAFAFSLAILLFFFFFLLSFFFFFPPSSGYAVKLLILSPCKFRSENFTHVNSVIQQFKH